MESGLPFLYCLYQHALKSLCTCSDSSNPSKWVYAVFWRIIPRNYPPPKWDHGGGPLDRDKGNKRNWILVWEDGFCDFDECERAGKGYPKGRFGADIFFKMSHEVYNFGEGIVGKVAAENSHKWVFRDSPTDNDPTFISSWNASIDLQPKAWEAQFNAGGIETIAIISVKDGAIQLGSFYKIDEDLNWVVSIRRTFSYLYSLPGTFAIQQSYLPIDNPNNFDRENRHVLIETNGTLLRIADKHQMIGSKRKNYEQSIDNLGVKSRCLGYNSPHHMDVESFPIWSIPNLLPSLPCNLGAFVSKTSDYPSECEVVHSEKPLLNNQKSGSANVKVDASSTQEKPRPLS